MTFLILLAPFLVICFGITGFALLLPAAQVLQYSLPGPDIIREIPGLRLARNIEESDLSVNTDLVKTIC